MHTLPKSTCLFLYVIWSSMIYSQVNLTVEGHANISQMDDDSLSDSIVVWQLNGNLAVSSISQLQNLAADSCRLGYYTIPQDFDFQNIPATHANAIWEIKNCHDLSGANVTILIM